MPLWIDLREETPNFLARGISGSESEKKRCDRCRHQFSSARQQVIAEFQHPGLEQ